MKKFLFILLFPALLFSQGFKGGTWKSPLTGTYLKLSRDATIGGTLAVTGAVTLSSTLQTTGNIGIGTEPNVNLHIKTTSPTIKIHDSDGVSGFSLIQGNNAGALFIKADENNVGSGVYISFDVSTLEVLRMLESGNVGIGTAAPVNLLNVDGAYNFFADSSNVNDSWGFSTTGIEVLTTGMSIYVQIGVENTDGATLQINALGAKAVHKLHNQDLATGDVEVGQILHLVYDGTDFQMLSQLAQ